MDVPQYMNLLTHRSQCNYGPLATHQPYVQFYVHDSLTNYSKSNGPRVVIASVEWPENYCQLFITYSTFYSAFYHCNYPFSTFRKWYSDQKIFRNNPLLKQVSIEPFRRTHKRIKHASLKWKIASFSIAN